MLTPLKRKRLSYFITTCGLLLIIWFLVDEYKTTSLDTIKHNLVERFMVHEDTDKAAPNPELSKHEALTKTSKPLAKESDSAGQSYHNLSLSYRFRPDRYGISIELNKFLDDYTYCPRTEPFLGPFDYIKESKSPCWWDEGKFQCVPYFYIVGFSKCGTTDLFYRTAQHPQIVITGHKEKHWFDYERFIENRRFIQNYTHTFQNAITDIEKALAEKGSSNLVIADATPCYISGSFNWPCYEGNEMLDEPKYTNADVIYRLTPMAKIIVIVREPTKMLYSRMLQWVDEPYLHPAYKNPTPEMFHDLITNAINKYTECFQRWSPRHCAYNGTLYSEVRLRLYEGMFAIFLKDWMNVFPRDQILVIRFDDYIHDPAIILRTVHAFLDLESLSDSELMKEMSLSVANPGKRHHFAPLLNQTVAALEDFYRPFIKELCELLGDEKFAWHYRW